MHVQTDVEESLDFPKRHTANKELKFPVLNISALPKEKLPKNY